MKSKLHNLIEIELGIIFTTEIPMHSTNGPKTVQIVRKGAITGKIKHAIKLKTSPARLAQLLHNCCSPH